MLGADLELAGLAGVAPPLLGCVGRIHVLAVAAVRVLLAALEPVEIRGKEVGVAEDASVGAVLAGPGSGGRVGGDELSRGAEGLCGAEGLLVQRNAVAVGSEILAQHAAKALASDLVAGA